MTEKEYQEKLQELQVQLAALMLDGFSAENDADWSQMLAIMEKRDKLDAAMSRRML